MSAYNDHDMCGGRGKYSVKEKLPQAILRAPATDPDSSATVKKFRELVVRHEGFRKYPYTDTLGNLTIGHGINLTLGLDDAELEFLFSHRLGIAEAGAVRVFNSFRTLSLVRQAVLVDMCYQDLN